MNTPAIIFHETVKEWKRMLIRNLIKECDAEIEVGKALLREGKRDT